MVVLTRSPLRDDLAGRDMPVWNDAGAWCWADDGGAMSKRGAVKDF